jgi:hypothetical protein
VPAYTIYGAPTAASKTDAKTGAVKPSVVNVTVTTASKAKVVYEIDVTVDALPEWAVGTFDGCVWSYPSGLAATSPASGEELSGAVTMTVAANGKISGKLIDADGTWTLSAAWFDGVTGTRDACPYQDPESGSQESEVGSPVFVATVIGKNGKKAITNEVTVAAEEVRLAGDGSPYRRGVVSGWTASAPSVEWTAWQNPWKQEPWKTDAKPFAKAPALDIDAGTRDACPYPGTITLKFAASGAVTASGKFVTGQDAKGKDVVYSASCSGVLIPASAQDARLYQDAGDARIRFTLFLYFPPKAGKFEGYGTEISLVWDGAAFSVAAD